MTNLAARRQSEKPTAATRDYQALLAQRANQEHEANIRVAERQFRALRRNTWTERSQNTTPDHSETSTETDPSETQQTLSSTPQTPVTTKPQQTIQMTLPNDFPFFSGEETDTEKPGSWLKRLERTWTPTTSDATKIHDFETSLDADSVAEAWWDALDAAHKGTWADVRAAFKTEWPASKILDVSAATRRDIMMSYKVLEEDLGKMEGEGRRKDYTHALWADKIEPLWKQLGDNNGLLIPEVRGNLPQSLLDSLPETKDINKDYKIFLQAVREVSIEKVIRRREELKRLQELEQQVSSLSQTSWTPPSQISRLTQKFASTSLNQTYPSYSRPTYTSTSPTKPVPNMPNQNATITVNPSTPYIPPQRRDNPPHMQTTVRQQPTPANSNTNPFEDVTTPRPNNQFYQRLQMAYQTSPLAYKTGNPQQLAQAAIHQSRVYPDNETGHLNYTRDITAWETAYGKDAQMMFTKDPLPLTPGTAPLGSQECYQCGRAEAPPHIGADCTSTVRIPQRESSWRNYISKILFPIGQRGNTPRNQPYRETATIAPIYATDGDYVEYDPYLYPIENVAFQDEQQGKGLESRE